MRSWLILGAALLFAAPGMAYDWQVDPVTSRLTFEGQQSGERFTGSFPKFTSSIALDPAAPEKGRITITVDMASVQVDGKDRQESILTSDWFDARQFPTATFSSSSIRATGADKTGIEHFLAKGTLTMRGITKPIELPFSLKTTGSSAIARGELTLNRRDFGIGAGKAWETDQWVAFPVRVQFELHAGR